MSGSSRKGCLWALNLARIDKMEEEMHKWKRKDLAAIHRSMANPGEAQAPHHTHARTRTLTQELARCPSCNEYRISLTTPVSSTDMPHKTSMGKQGFPTFPTILEQTPQSNNTVTPSVGYHVEKSALSCPTGGSAKCETFPGQSNIMKLCKFGPQFGSFILLLAVHAEEIKDLSRKFMNKVIYHEVISDGKKLKAI